MRFREIGCSKKHTQLTPFYRTPRTFASEPAGGMSGSKRIESIGRERGRRQRKYDGRDSPRGVRPTVVFARLPRKAAYLLDVTPSGTNSCRVLTKKRTGGRQIIDRPWPSQYTSTMPRTAQLTPTGLVFGLIRRASAFLQIFGKKDARLGKAGFFGSQVTVHGFL